MGETRFHLVAEYIVHVEEYYRELRRVQGYTGPHRIYLAADELMVSSQIVDQFPHLEVLHNASFTAMAQNKNTRYSEKSLHGVLMDVMHLSECDFLVCAFSSQVCRLAFELMQTKGVDASKRFVSLDDTYYFGGGKFELLQAVERHEALDGDIVLEIGDVIQNHARPDGWRWKGVNTRTGEVGMYPAYKVVPYQDADTFQRW